VSSKAVVGSVLECSLLDRPDTMRIFGSVVQGLGTALELLQARHRVLAENVANAETPGYRARDLDFQDALGDAFTSASSAVRTSATSAGGAPAPTAESTAGRVVTLEPVVDRDAVIKIDRNSVDLDTEMARLSENAFRIVALSQILARRYDGLKRIIDGGAR
jgi:flagellar basal-body rod protein FlgB